MSSAFDYLSRVIMLVLAGLVTLSIIGAIASIPSGSIGTRIGLERGEPLPPPEAGEQDRTLAAPDIMEANASGIATLTSTETVAAAKPKNREPVEWLEAITYALIALVGLVALGCLLLWQGLAQQSRIAGALETIANRSDFT